jgi:hypothetical protein
VTLAVIYEVNIQPTSSSAIDSEPWIWSKAALGSEMVTACIYVAISAAMVIARWPSAAVLDVSAALI